MFELVYTSTARPHLSQSDLREILSRSRGANARDGITGILLWHHGAFLQVLEGEESAVENLFAAIQRDNRHHDLKLVSRLFIVKRGFEDWSMNFLDTSDWKIKPGLIGYNSLQNFAQVDSTMKPYLRLFHVGLSRSGALA